MNDKNIREDRVSRLTGCQSTLFAYILGLVPDVNSAQDILQDTNLVIWGKLEDGTEVHNFIAWAREVARYKVLAYLRDQGRDRLVFDADFVEHFADKAETAHQDSSSWMTYLEECLKLRPEEERQLLKERYEPGVSNSPNRFSNRPGLPAKLHLVEGYHRGTFGHSVPFQDTNMILRLEVL